MQTESGKRIIGGYVEEEWDMGVCCCLCWREKKMRDKEGVMDCRKPGV